MDVMSTASEDPRRRLPSVDALVSHPAVQALLEGHPRVIVMESLRETLAAARERLAGGGEAPGRDALAEAVAAHLRAREHERLRPAINATGIVLHTGLGRAVLPRRAARALAQLDRCCNLQIDLDTGKRGKRNYMTERLLCLLTGAEAAMVVNNNAAATFLILSALCKGREVVVSRGQLIEIGGSFRLPDCVHQAGAILVEVGTTNKTHLRDYEAALSEATAALLRVHPSNFRVLGFSKEVPVRDLVSLKRKRDVLVIDDLGGGALVDLARLGLPHEPTVMESIAAGADLACFSGDKLIGGPQAGIIVGRKDLIAVLRKHPLTRMLRVDKLTDLALEETLRLFLDPDTLLEENPTLRMLRLPLEQVRAAAETLEALVRHAAPKVLVDVRRGESESGGGALPVTPLPTYVVAVRVEGIGPQRLHALLRENEPPIVARVEDGAVLLDPRTLLEGDAGCIAEALGRIAP